jgi:hypothetical protein
MSLHVLIATTGRPCLRRMLASLQLEERDCLTIVFDGCAVLPFELPEFKCKVNVFFEPEAYGYWGHGVRNKYAKVLERRDFVLHADDDDEYVDGAFQQIRERCTDMQMLYFTQMQAPSGLVIPRDADIRYANVGTPNGVIPFDLNSKGVWEPMHGGDGMFYEQLIKLSPFVFLDVITYQVKGPGSYKTDFKSVKQ